jgi:phosphosulfolactate synthase (CoM biosynthesis protein A)
MNANKLADKLMSSLTMEYDCDKYMEQAATMLRQQQAQINKYIQVLESIANEQVELSHDKIKWQNEDHIKWAKDALK